MSKDRDIEVSDVQVIDLNEELLPSPAINSQSLSSIEMPHVGALNMQSLKAVVENYLSYYAQGTSHTSRAKRYDLKHFLEFLAGPGGHVDDLKVSDWTLQQTKDFVDERLAIGEAPATVSRRLATIKHFGRTLAERVHGFVNPAREAKGPSLKQSRPHGLSPEEIELLKLAISSSTKVSNPPFAKVRNAFLLEVLLATGLRADEVRLLVMGQITDDQEWLKNVKTKGKKFRNVYLNTDIRNKLIQYLTIREAELSEKYPGVLSLSPKEQERFPVLISLYRPVLSEPRSLGLSPKSIWRIISDFGKAAQSLSSNTQVGNLHPHKLRHTFAHGLLESSHDVRLVAQALGHSDVRTTMRYTERGDEEIAEAIEQKLSKERKT